MRHLINFFILLFVFGIMVTCEKENNPPTCNISAPQQNAEIKLGEDILIAVNAKDEDGSIVEIRLYIDDIGITSLTNFPYNFTWDTKDATLGNHSIKAVAFDDGGMETEASLDVKIFSDATVITGQISNISLNSAVCTARITGDGGSEVTQRGICWNTIGTPTVDDNKTDDGSGIGEYTSTLKGLQKHQTYYARAYATTMIGTSYGEEISFKMESEEIEKQELNYLLSDFKAKGYEVDSTKLGIYYILHEEGEGPFAQPGDTLSVEYTAYFANGEIFDGSSFHYVDGIWEFIFKDVSLILGFEDGIALMNKDAKIEMIIPSKLAYGSIGSAAIPPFTTLIFMVRMHDIKPKT